ncbi:MAG: GNAT family N-acetyltransferase [Bacteroidia bacterium]
MNPETIHTERLVLRIYTPEISNHIFNELNSKELQEFLGIEKEDDLSRERNKYYDSLTTFNKKFCYFHLIEKKTSKLIGWCGFHTWYIDHNRAELGYVLNDESHMNKGYMTEVLNEVLKYGFEQMQLHRIEAFVGSNNTPSLKLTSRFNFTQEGLLREHYCKEGKMEDSLIFGLLKSEFEAAHNSTNE